MVNTYHRAANDLDLKALVEGRGSLGRNLLVTVLPGSLALFGVVYLLWRSLLAASVAGAGIFLMLLVGQWLMDYKSFPCESFRFHRWSDIKKPIRIEVTGRTIEAEKSEVQLRPHKYGRMELLDAAPETLQDDLEGALSKHSA